MEQSEQIKITLSDKILAKTFLRFFPKSVRPNHITVARFILTPFVIWLVAVGDLKMGGVLFLITAFTDALDGAMARTRDQITEWGKIYDPLADKILICSIVYIFVFNYVDRYAAWIIIVLEFFIIIAALYRKSNGYKIQSNVWGKIKMNLQVLGVLILLVSIIFNLEQLMPFTRGTFYLAIAFGVLSLFTYGI